MERRGLTDSTKTNLREMSANWIHLTHDSCSDKPL
jgi:hypothetical protein